jgi:hypothetical protein
VTTFLTNKKMSPELAARVEASVTGRTPGRSRQGARARRTALVRLTVAATVATLVGGVAVAWERGVSEREGARAALLDALSRESSGVTVADLEAPPRVEALLLKTYGAYPGDLVPPALHAPGRLEALLAEEALYVRGPVEAFRSASAIASAATESGKDTLLACLLEPPASEDERVLLERVRAIRAGDRAVVETLRHVHRLADALVGLPLLAPAWRDRVRTASTLRDLTSLRRTLDRAPLGQARAAARAKILIVVQDEPKEPGTITELDGATVHDVRVGIYDVRSGETRLRVRRRADPEWISERRRPHDARELEDCRLGGEIRRSVVGARPTDSKAGQTPEAGPKNPL